MTDRIYSLNEIKSMVSPIADKYGVERVYLFGSYARGEATVKSDIDLRIDKGKLKGLFALGGMYSELEESTDKNIDLLTTGSLEQSFLDEIAKEEILIYGVQ